MMMRALSFYPRNTLGQIENAQMRIVLPNRRHPCHLETDTPDAQIRLALGHSHHLARRRFIRLRTLTGRHDRMHIPVLAGNAFDEITLRLHRHRQALSVQRLVPSPASRKQEKRRSKCGHHTFLQPFATEITHRIPRRQATYRKNRNEDGQNIPRSNTHRVIITDKSPRAT